MIRGRVALVRPHCESEFTEPCEPLGPEYLAAALRAEGIGAKVFDRELDGHLVPLQIAEYYPAVLVLSIMTMESLGDAQRLALQLRERIPGLAIVAGGLYVTTCPQQAEARLPAGTHLLRGEGECTLPRLCHALLSKLPVADAPPLYPAPGQWPPPVRERLGEYLAAGAAISLRTSRGCPGSCSFCATPGLPPPLNRWAPRSVESVADEMAELCAKHHPAVFNMVDDNFGPLSRVEELVEALDRRRVHAAFSLQLRAAAFRGQTGLRERLARLKAGGLCRIFVGVESLHPDTLRYFHKTIDPRQVQEALATAREAGIETHIGYILWHPLATEESVREEATRLREAGFFSVKVALSRLVLFAGSRLHREAACREAVTWAPIGPEAVYTRLMERINPLYRVWVDGATALPRLSCLAHLSGAPADRDAVARVNAALERLDSLAYRELMAPGSMDSEEIEAVAMAAGGELDAVGCAGMRRGRSAAAV